MRSTLTRDWDALRRLLPGLAVVSAIAALALVGGRAFGPSSPLVWAILLGALVAPLASRMPVADEGVGFAARRLLRIGVALLGLRISLDQIAHIGISGVVLVTLTVALTLAVTLWASSRLAVARNLGLLIAIGTAICGASAIAAASAVLRAREEEAAYAIAAVTAYGTVVMFLLPFLSEHVIGLTATEVGLWVGASIHEVAQVAVAGTAVSAVTLQVATVVKLGRVVLLAPVMGIAWVFQAGPNARRSRVDWFAVLPGFVIAFLVLATIRTVLTLPTSVISLANDLSIGLLTAALAALGLQISVGDLRAQGFRPLTLGLISSLVAATVPLLLLTV